MSNTRLIFKESIGQTESKGTGGYKAKNPKSSAVGKYQFLWNTWKDRIKQFSGNPNLTEEDFKNDPALQDSFMEHYDKTVLEPEAVKLQKRHGSKFKNRGIQDIDDAKALLHYQGYGGARHFLTTGEALNPENNKPIKEYLDEARNQRKLLQDKANQRFITEV